MPDQSSASEILAYLARGRCSGDRAGGRVHKRGADQRVVRDVGWGREPGGPGAVLGVATHSSPLVVYMATNTASPPRVAVSGLKSVALCTVSVSGQLPPASGTSTRRGSKHHIES